MKPRREVDVPSDRPGAGVDEPRPLAGFTLVELVSVVAIVSMLAGLLTPTALAAIAALRIERAEQEVANIGQSLVTFHRSLGEWPGFDARDDTARAHLLVSGARVPLTNPWANPHPFWAWMQRGGAETLNAHLYQNGEGGTRYPTTGRRAWRGPYIEPAGLDPWGRPYVVNLIAAYDDGGEQHRRMWVLSGGPDGVIQTSAVASVEDEVAGDDIGFLVLER